MACISIMYKWGHPCIRLKLIPSDIDQFFNLSKIDIRRQSISMIPDELTNINSLEEISLIQCLIKDVPQNINQLIKLRNLDLCGNLINTIPEVICDILSLVLVDFAGCPINHIASNFSKLGNLRRLDVGEYVISNSNLLSDFIHIKNKVKILHKSYWAINRVYNFC